MLRINIKVVVTWLYVVGVQIKYNWFGQSDKRGFGKKLGT